MNIEPTRIRERLVALGKDPTDGGQTWLAGQVGMKPQGIQSIMSGGVKRPRKLLEIAKALQTTEAYLLGEPVPAGGTAPPELDLAIRLADAFAGILHTRNRDLQNQIATYIEGRLSAHYAQLRATDT